MKGTDKYSTNEPNSEEHDLLALKAAEELFNVTDRQVHRLNEGIICRTDYRPVKRDPRRIVVDATEGFIPLWAENLVLRWKFNEGSLAIFQQPEAIKNKIRDLFNSAIMAWGDAAPIRFAEVDGNADFEIFMENNDDCNPQGCTLAQAFFPDGGRHQLYIFPKMFGQIKKEQVDTLTHEIGHVFGLRHFFAPEQETPWPSEIFGESKPFSIMNYGDKSELTDVDRSDLEKLYKSAWSGQLTKINGTPIKFVQPFHYLGA
jgi:Matrixin